MDILTNEVGISRNKIYNISLSPSPQIGLYEGYFEFCQRDLSENPFKNDPESPYVYDFQPAFFFFLNNFSVNAGAGIHNNSYLISVNMGYMNQLYNIYFVNNYPLKSNPVFAKYVSLENIGFGSLENFMYNLTLQFTYYHEKAHLYQKKNSLFWINENYIQSTKEFDFQNHVLEFDADIHAVNWICWILITYHLKLESKWQNSETMNKIICLGTASILGYFTKLQDDFKNMYFKEKSHPHSIIRIMYILNAFILILEKRIPQLTLNREAIITEAFVIAKTLLHSNNSALVSFNVFDLTDILEKHEKQINSYIKELGDTAFSGKMPFLAIHKIVNN